jgi:hypothetical protein
MNYFKLKSLLAYTFSFTVHQASQMVIINGYGVEVIIVVLQPETYFSEYLTKSLIKYSPSETLVEFGFGCKYINNNRRIRFYYQVINVVINTTTTTCNIPV